MNGELPDRKADEDDHKDKGVLMEWWNKWSFVRLSIGNDIVHKWTTSANIFADDARLIKQAKGIECS